MPCTFTIWHFSYFAFAYVNRYHNFDLFQCQRNGNSCVKHIISLWELNGKVNKTCMPFLEQNTSHLEGLFHSLDIRHKSCKLTAKLSAVSTSYCAWYFKEKMGDESAFNISKYSLVLVPVLRLKISRYQSSFKVMCLLCSQCIWTIALLLQTPGPQYT